MLQFIRNRAQTWFAWVIVGLLIIPFALWGINEYFDGGGKLVAATVNGQDINLRLYQESYQQQRSRMQEMLGAQYDAAVFDERIRQEVIDRLVEEELLLQKAEEAGLQVSDTSIAQVIQGIEAFQVDGKFSKDAYVRQLALTGDTSASFEQRIRRFILASQLQAGLTGTALVTNEEIESIVRLQQQKREVAYFTLEAKTFAQSMQIGDTDIEAYYNANQDRYSVPEQVSLEYIELSADQLGQAVQASDDQLQAYFKEHANQYSVAEERELSHILIELSANATPEVKQAALDQASALRARLLKGESFADLARQFSADPGSAQQGGSLGFVGRGQMDPAFEQAAFALKDSEVSEPVLTTYGYHLIKVDSIRAQSEKLFDEVKAQVLDDFRRSEGVRLYFEHSDTLTNLTFENPDSLVPAAEALGLKVQTTEKVSRGSRGPGILGQDAVVAAAFGDDVLTQGFNSQPVEIGDHHVVVIRIKEHQPSAVKPLINVRDAIRQDMLQERASEQARQKGEELLARARGGENPGQMAKESGAKYQPSVKLGRGDRGINPVILRKVFELNRPSGDQPVYGGVQLENGDYAVIGLTAVEEGDLTGIDEAAQKNLVRSLAAARGAAEYRALLEALKSEATITINRDNL